MANTLQNVDVPIACEHASVQCESCSQQIENDKNLISLDDDNLSPYMVKVLTKMREKDTGSNHLLEKPIYYCTHIDKGFTLMTKREHLPAFGATDVKDMIKGVANTVFMEMSAQYLH